MKSCQIPPLVVFLQCRSTRWCRRRRRSTPDALGVGRRCWCRSPGRCPGVRGRRRDLLDLDRTVGRVRAVDGLILPDLRDAVDELGALLGSVEADDSLAEFTGSAENGRIFSFVSVEGRRFGVGFGSDLAGGGDVSFAVDGPGRADALGRIGRIETAGARDMVINRLDSECDTPPSVEDELGRAQRAAPWRAGQVTTYRCSVFPTVRLPLPSS